MRKLVILGLAAIVAVGFLGCAGKQILDSGIGISKAPPREKGTPNWVPLEGKQTVLEPEVLEGKVLQGVGVSEKKANIRAMRETSLADAMGNLGTQVTAHLEKVATVVLGNWQDALQKDQESSMEEVKSLIKIIVEVDLPGPKPVQEFEDVKSGRYWTRILMSSATTEKWLLEKMKSEKEFKRLIIEAKSNQIKQELEKELDKVREREKAEQNAVNSIIKSKNE